MGELPGVRPARIVTLGPPQSHEVCSGGPGSPTYSSSMSSRPRPSRATWDRLMEVCTTVWRRGEEEEAGAVSPPVPLDPTPKPHPEALSQRKSSALALCPAPSRGLRVHIQLLRTCRGKGSDPLKPEKEHLRSFWRHTDAQ